MRSTNLTSMRHMAGEESGVASAFDLDIFLERVRTRHGR
ncbi:type II toxin-antitoxin system ParD family antitoxin [Paraburkholderia tropica]